MNEGLFPPIYIFVAWVLLLAALITVVMVYRWRHPDRHSRFQLKLTLGLILFLMIPTIPLVFVAGIAVDEARGLMVALPVDDALESGLEAIRHVVEPEETRLAAWRDEMLGISDAGGAAVDFTLRFEADGDGWRPTGLNLGRDSTPPVPADTLMADPPDLPPDLRDVLDDAFFTGDEQVLFHYRGTGVYMALVRQSDTDHLEAAGLWMDPSIVEARQRLDQGLQGFRKMVLLGGRRTQEVVWMVASIWLVVLTIAAFWTTRWLSQGVSGPVVELARGMGQVAEGDLSTRLEIRAKDEMRVLVDTFNQMTGDLQEARARIVAAEKQAAWRDVARRIAHEIKNPLTPMRIGLHRVKSRLQSEGIWESEEGLRESLLTMSEEVEALQRMAVSFSEFAELPQPTMAPGDIEAVVRGAAALFQEGSDQVVLEVHVHGALPPVSMDADLAKRAVINLMKNAIESVHTTDGGAVHVRLEGRGEEILLEIRDNGAGFEPELAPRLFDPDFSTKARGTGLGLSVVARIVSDHGWRIEAESAGKGAGATVRVHIPVERRVSS